MRRLLALAVCGVLCDGLYHSLTPWVRSQTFRGSTMEHIYPQSTKSAEADLGLGDFELILDAVYTFQKVHGDLNIPIKFVVPPEEPWSPKLHGMRVGKRLEKLFSSNEFCSSSQHQDKFEALKSLGIEPSMSSLVDDWDMIKIALMHYKTTFDNVRVPSKFVVPDTDDWPRVTRGLKLGVRVAAIRSAGRYVKDHPVRKAELEALGFEWRLRELPPPSGGQESDKSKELFEQIIDALQIYKANVDFDLHVPVTFIVPEASDGGSSVWPESLRGFPLGRWVSNLRDKDSIVDGFPDREERLSDLGFVWEGSGRALFSKRRFDMVYSALTTYKNLHGDLFVPQAFTVPKSEPWPQSTWGLKLGARVNAIRSQGTLVANAPDRRERLDQLGFIWELPSHVKREKKRKELEEFGIKSSLLESDGFGQSMAGGGRSGHPGGADFGRDYNKPGPKPNAYNLPPFGGLEGARVGDTWVMGTKGWSLDESGAPINFDAQPPLSSSAHSTSHPGQLSGERRSLMNFDPARMFEPSAYREVASEALGIYMRDREYSADPIVRQWSHFEGHLNPERFHRTISRTIPPDDIKWMKKVSYRIMEFGRFSWDTFADALSVYSKHYGNASVPQEFVVDEEKIRLGVGFTEDMEDLALGEAVMSVRIGDIDGLEDPIRRKFLDSVKFDWGDKSKYLRFRFPPMLLGLKVFKHLFGFPLPQHDFVVPDEPQWPYWMVNMPLGEWAAIARAQQKMIQVEYPDRVDMLNALEFLWWIPPGPIPAKWFRPLR